MNRDNPATENGQTMRILRQATDAIRASFARLLLVKDEDKPAIYIQVFRNSEIADMNYWLEVTFAIGIATLGLIINSPAVVIGAMLISPLMGPIFALGMGIALGDFYLGFRSLLSVVLSIFGSIALAALITWPLPFHSPTSEILSRVQPTLLDLAIAILSGLAGAIVVCRGGSGGGVTALPGVAVAVALMPPLAVVGFGIGIGWDWTIVRGGGLLFLTNLVAIVLSSVLVFFSIRMDAWPVRRKISAWLEEQEPDDRMYRALQRTPLRHLFGTFGTLPRRLLILILFLVPVCVPLLRTLHRLVVETNARRVVQAELERVIPKDSLFRQDVSVSQDHVHVSAMAVLPRGFSEAQRKEVEQAIAAKTGLTVDLSIFEVPTRSELTNIIARTASTTQAPLESLDELNAKIWQRLRPELSAAWPQSTAPLIASDVEIQQSSAELLLHVVYLSDVELGELGQASVQQVLQERSGTKNIRLSTERVPATWPVKFRNGSSILSAGDTKALGAALAALKRYSALRCSIEVPAGNAEKLNALESRRAEAIQKAMRPEAGAGGCAISPTAQTENFGVKLRIPVPSGP